MRTMTHRIDCSFEDDTGSRSFNHYDGDGFVQRGVSAGSAHNAQNISSFTIPPRGGGHPFFPAIDGPVAVLKLSDGADALARQRSSGVGAAVRFGGAKACQRRSALLQERIEQSASLLRRA